MKTLYLVLIFIGLIAPYILIAQFAMVNGINFGEFWRQMWATHISSMAMTDLLLSCFVFWVYMKKEADKYKINNLWIYLVSTLAIGLCFALPLFLYVREGKKELIEN